MKKTVIAATFILLALSATACGQKAAGNVQTTEAMTTEAETTVGETAQEGEKESEASDTADFSKKLTEFTVDLKLVVKSKDLDGLIAMSAFPVYISSVETNEGIVESVEEFGEIDPSSIFTEDFTDVIISYDLKKVTKTEAGYVIGEGTPNITFKEQDGTFKITGLNIK